MPRRFNRRTLDFPTLPDALCTRYDPELWFPGKGRRPNNKEQKAILICNSCPELEPCRAFARKHSLQGIWGGESERERRKKSRGKD